MSEILTFVGTYGIPEGGADEFDAANKEMADFVRANEPRIISWATYVNEEHTEATTIMVHPDSESLEYHLEVAGKRIGHNVQVLQTRRVELFGKASDSLVEKLRRVSELSGSWPVIVKPRLRGFPD